MIRVVVADDHTLFRDGLVRLLGTKNDIEIVGQAGTGREAIQQCEKHKPDVLLLDLDMPDMDGFEVTQHINASKVNVKILILTMHSTEEYAYRLLKSGASGFIVKDIAATELPAAIKKVAEGGTYVSSSVMEGIALKIRQQSEEDPLALLSDREIQVASKLAMGKSISEISDDLNLSPHTVETYKSRLMSKLGHRNIADLTRFAIKTGLISNF